MHQAILATTSAALFFGASLFAQGPIGYALGEGGKDFQPLFAIDLSSGETTQLGGLGTDGIDGLAFAPDGRLFGVDDVADELVQIDLATGDDTVIGPLGVDVEDCGFAIDIAGSFWLSDDENGLLYRLNPFTGAAELRGTTPEGVTGLGAIGTKLFGLTSDGTNQLVRIDTKKGTVTTVGSLANVNVGDGGIDFDAHGRLWGVSDSGTIFRIDPLTGVATEIAQTNGGLNGLAIPTRQVCGYTVDNEATDQLWLVDLVTGASIAIGPVGFASVSGLAFDSTGRLFGVDDATDVLLEVDPGTGAGTVIGALGVDVANVGLGFDDTGALFLSERFRLRSVSTTTGAAVLIGNMGGSTCYALAFTRGTLYGVSLNNLVDGGPGTLLRSIERANANGSFIGTLDPVNGEFSGLDLGPDGVLWGLDRTGATYIVSTEIGTAVRAAQTLVGCESLAIAPCPVGRGSFVPLKASFKTRPPEGDGLAGEDSLQLKGRLDSRGIEDDLSGATLELYLNDTSLTGALELDENGAFRSPAGAAPAISCSVSSPDGAFSLRFQDIELDSLLGIRNVDAVSGIVARFDLRLEGAGLRTPRQLSRVIFDMSAKLDRGAKGKFSSKKNVTSSGAFRVTKAAAEEIAGGSHDLSLQALFRPNGGGPLDPADVFQVASEVRVVIGDADPILIPFGSLAKKGAGLKTAYRYSAQLGPVPHLVKLDLSNSKGSLKLEVTGLEGTGIPAAGAGVELVHELPILVEVRTAGVTEHLTTVVVLERETTADGAWSAR